MSELTMDEERLKRALAYLYWGDHKFTENADHLSINVTDSAEGYPIDEAIPLIMEALQALAEAVGESE